MSLVRHNCHSYRSSDLLSSVFGGCKPGTVWNFVCNSSAQLCLPSSCIWSVYHDLSLICLRPAEWWACYVFCDVLPAFAASSQLLGVCKIPYWLIFRSLAAAEFDRTVHWTQAVDGMQLWLIRQVGRWLQVKGMPVIRFHQRHSLLQHIAALSRKMHVLGHLHSCLLPWADCLHKLSDQARFWKSRITTSSGFATDFLWFTVSSSCTQAAYIWTTTALTQLCYGQRSVWQQRTHEQLVSQGLDQNLYCMCILLHVSLYQIAHMLLVWARCDALLSIWQLHKHVVDVTLDGLQSCLPLCCISCP